MANEAGVLRGGADASSYQVGSQGYFAPKAAPSKGNYGQATNAKAIDFSAPPPIAPPPVAPSQQAFDPDAYLAANPKLQEYLKTHPNFDPAKHWIKYGKQEGRPSGQVGSPQVAPSPVAPSPVAPSPVAPSPVAPPGVTPNIPPEMLENIRAAADAYRTGLPQQALRAPLASEPSIPPIDSGRFAGVQQQIEALRGSGGLPGPPSAPPPSAPPPMAAPAAQAAPAAGNKGNQQALYAAARAAMAAKPPSVPGGYGGRINVNL